MGEGCETDALGRAGCYRKLFERIISNKSSFELADCVYSTFLTVSLLWNYTNELNYSLLYSIYIPQYKRNYTALLLEYFSLCQINVLLFISLKLSCMLKRLIKCNTKWLHSTTATHAALDLCWDSRSVNCEKNFDQGTRLWWKNIQVKCSIHGDCPRIMSHFSIIISRWTLAFIKSKIW